MVAVDEQILRHYQQVSGEHDRFRSWEHCYRYFRKTIPHGLCNDREQAAVQLAFYLASWGMYRASSFLFRHAFTVHLGVIEILDDSSFTDFWNAEFGAEGTADLGPQINAAIKGITNAYRRFGHPTDTLVTKVMLGTFGGLPAC